MLGSEQAPEERAAGDPAQGSQAGQPALQREDLCPLPAEPGPCQPQGQHLPGLQPLGVSGLPFLWPQQCLALQSLRQGGVSTQGQVAAMFCTFLPSPSSSQLDAPWPTFPSPAGFLQCRAAVSAVTSQGGQSWLGDGELGYAPLLGLLHSPPTPFPPSLDSDISPCPWRSLCLKHPRCSPSQPPPSYKPHLAPVFAEGVAGPPVTCPVHRLCPVTCQLCPLCPRSPWLVAALRGALGLRGQPPTAPTALRCLPALQRAEEDDR